LVASLNTIEAKVARSSPASALCARLILLTKASTHVFATEVSETKRTADTLEVRLDARTIPKRDA